MAKVELPTNPFKDGPLLLVPERFLRELPVLNADDWWHHYENERLRQDVNYHVMGRVDKDTIIREARRNPQMVRQWTLVKEDSQPKSYDCLRDPSGVYGWDEASYAFALAHPLGLTPAKTDKEFFEVIERVVEQFRLFIEDQGGWELLWDGDKEKREHAAQLLFRGIAMHYCKANDISLDAEVNLGRGPVDFKFSSGYSRRAHLEVKKTHNGKFWDGLTAQLPSYMKSDQVSDGWFLAMSYKSGKREVAKCAELPKRVAQVAKANGVNLRWALVDATRKKSASKLKGT